MLGVAAGELLARGALGRQQPRARLAVGSGRCAGGPSVGGRARRAARVLEQRRQRHVALLLGWPRIGRPRRVDDDPREPAPQLVGEVRVGEDVARDPVEVDLRDLRASGVVDGFHAGAHGRVARVVGEDRRVRQRRRVEQVLDVAAHAVGGVVAVDEHEVDVAPGGRELGEEGGQQLVRVAGVQRDVRQRAGLEHGLEEVEGVHLGGVRGDQPEGRTLRRPDLDRQSRLQRRQHALERRPLAAGHLRLGQLVDRMGVQLRRVVLGLRRHGF